MKFNLRVTAATAAFAALTSTICHAQSSANPINVDITSSGLQSTSASTFKVTNLAVTGLSTRYTVEFAWDAVSLSFRPITAIPDTSQKWKVTTGIVNYKDGSFSQDLSGLCAAQFGFGHVQADWADVVAWINNDAAKAQTFITSAAIRPGPDQASATPVVLATYLAKSTVSAGFGINPVGIFGVANSQSTTSILGGTVFLGYTLQSNLRVLCNNKAAS